MTGLWQIIMMAKNDGRTKHSLFHKPGRVDDLPLERPKLSINNIKSIPYKIS